MQAARCCGVSARGGEGLDEAAAIWSFRGMIVLRTLRRRARFLLGPILGIALTGYFAYHLVEGDRGFNAYLRLNREIRIANANLDAARAQRAALDLKVSDLRPDHVDPDLLDERIRATLNLISPDEIVIMRSALSH
jgi:cell division protein FtsB